MGIGTRLREERERLGLSQEGLGTLGGVRKQAQLLYEKDERKPDSGYLEAVAASGADVLYILTGQRSSAQPAADAAEQVLLDSYRRCKPEARAHLIQTAALLSAGLPPAPSAAKTKKPKGGSTEKITLTSSHAGSVQIVGAKNKVSTK